MGVRISRIHVGLLCLLLVGGCSRQTDPVIGLPDTSRVEVAASPPEPTPEAVRLLVIAEDTTRGYDDRVAALCDLGRLGDRGAVARLLRLITPESDVVTLNAIIAVGDVGDPGALPSRSSRPMLTQAA